MENDPLYSLLILYSFLLVKAVYVHYKKFMGPKVHRVDLCPILNSLGVSLFFLLTSFAARVSYALLGAFCARTSPGVVPVSLPVATSVSCGFFPSYCSHSFVPSGFVVENLKEQPPSHHLPAAAAEPGDVMGRMWARRL